MRRSRRRPEGDTRDGLRGVDVSGSSSISLNVRRSSPPRIPCPCVSLDAEDDRAGSLTVDRSAPILAEASRIFPGRTNRLPQPGPSATLRRGASRRLAGAVSR